MDPISALAFSCNVIDLVEKAFKCGKVLHELYTSPTGRTAANDSVDSLLNDTRLVVGHLVETTNTINTANITNAGPGFGNPDQSLAPVVAHCRDLADRLQVIVDRCSAQKPRSVASTVKSGIKNLFAKDEIDHLQSELDRTARSLHFLLASSTRREITFIREQLAKSLADHQLTRFSLERLDEQLQAALQTRDSSDDLRKLIREAVAPTEAAMIYHNQYIILRAFYRSVDQRYEEVHYAAKATFGWVFDDYIVFEDEIDEDRSHRSDGYYPMSPVPPTDGDPDEAFGQVFNTSSHHLSRWLSSGSGIFHVAGKPGAGKSTLMKYIYDHRKTEELLKSWSKDRKLIRSKHFFWRLGAHSQRSFNGLIRSLLTDVVTAAPELCESLFSQFWNPKYFVSRKDFGQSISEREVLMAFERLTTESTNLASEYRFCFFIDGLDEFDQRLQPENERDLVESLIQWTKTSEGFIKICASSREIPVFERITTATKARIKVHELTADDIRLHVSLALGRYHYLDGSQLQTLIHMIAEQSEGVFLWVHLVLQTLSSSMENEDPFAMLVDKINVMPTEMEALFRQILGSIHSEYHYGVFTLFAIAMRMAGQLLSEDDGAIGKFPDPGLTKQSHRDNLGLLQYVSLIGGSLLLESFDQKHDLDSNWCPSDAQTIDGDDGLRQAVTDRERRASVQIKGRCKGLIDISKDGHWIIFTHRALPEFLATYIPETPTLHEITNSHTTEALAWMFLTEIRYIRLHNYEALCRSSKYRRGSFEYTLEPKDVLRQESMRSRCAHLLSRIRQIDLSREEATLDLLMWTDVMLLRVPCQFSYNFGKRPNDWYCCVNLLELACAAGPYEFVEHFIKNSARWDGLLNVEQVHEHILALVTAGEIGSPSVPQILDQLFAHGLRASSRAPDFWFNSILPVMALNNTATENQSWCSFLLEIFINCDSRFYPARVTFRREVRESEWKSIEVWLKHGADPRFIMRLPVETFSKVKRMAMRPKGIRDPLERPDEHSTSRICFSPEWFWISYAGFKFENNNEFGGLAEEVQVSLRELTEVLNPPNVTELLRLIDEGLRKIDELGGSNAETPNPDENSSATPSETPVTAASTLLQIPATLLILLNVTFFLLTIAWNLNTKYQWILQDSDREL